MVKGHKMKFSKLNEKGEPMVVNVSFPIETESGKHTESILTIWFEDCFLCEEIVEASDCYPILGMLNEKLPEGIFVSDVPSYFEVAKNQDSIDLKVYREIELY